MTEPENATNVTIGSLPSWFIPAMWIKNTWLKNQNYNAVLTQGGVTYSYDNYKLNLRGGYISNVD